MDGKVFNYSKVSLLVFSLLLVLFIFSAYFYNNKEFEKISYEIVSQDSNSKFQLVDLSQGGRKILATFDSFNSTFGKVLHKNNFWSPASCAAMPNLFLGGNFLTVLDVTRDSEKNKTIATFFVYDYEKNILKKSETVNFLVGDIYTIDKKKAIFFTYNNQKLTINFFNPSNFTILKKREYMVKEISPSFRFSEIDGKMYVKVMSEGSGIVNYKIDNHLEKVDTIPNKDFWNVINEKNKVLVSNNRHKIELEKHDYENYKTLKVSDSYIVFSRLNLYNMYIFTIELLDIQTKKLTKLYVNDAIENSYFLISVD